MLMTEEYAGLFLVVVVVVVVGRIGNKWGEDVKMKTLVQFTLTCGIKCP